MSYLSLARKYRPNTFSDLVGQESVGLALSNAIRLKREPRGVIFTGVRGIGKTTTARIYAKALNCEKGPTAEPCNICASCIAIQQGTHEDVLEIDGASNTGVDDVRALQETLAYVPQRSGYKVYIIDEVHMLSASAFNALLKTLEEPPQHVVFIFATTELQKVPETIQSRCQIFHLQKISTQLTKKRIADILHQEGITFEDRAIQWIAREGKGSLRDALTLLDQVIAIGGGSVPWVAVEPMANTGHSEPIYELLRLLVEKNSLGILNVIARWDQEGLAMTILVEELIKACRNAFVLKTLSSQKTELELLDLEERELQALRSLGQAAPLLEINRIFRTFVKCLDDLRNSELDRFVVENYALEWCLDPGFPDIAQLLQGQGAAAAGPAPVQVTSGAATVTMSPPQPAPTAISAPAAPAPPSMDLRDRWKKASAQTSASPISSSEPVAPLPLSHQAQGPSSATPNPMPARPESVPRGLSQNVIPKGEPSGESAPSLRIEALTSVPLTPASRESKSSISSSALVSPSLSTSASLALGKIELPPESVVPPLAQPGSASGALRVAPVLTPNLAPAAPSKIEAPSAPTSKTQPETSALTTGITAWPLTWKDFVDEWKKQKPLQARVLEETYSLEYTPEKIKLAVEAESLAGQKLLHFETRKKLLVHFDQLFGFKGILEVVPKGELTAANDNEPDFRETLLETKQKIKARERDDLKQRLEEHPLTREAILAFDGTIEAIEVQ